MPAPQHLGGVADLPLSGQEYQNVALAHATQFLDCIGKRLLLLFASRVLGIAGDRPVAHLHGIKTPRYLDDGRVVEMPGETLRIDGGRGNDDPEIAADFDELSQIADQKIDVQASLVGLVENDRAVLPQLGIALRLGKEDAVGHQLYRRVRSNAFVEPHLVSHQRADFGPELVGDARRHGTRGDAPRLRMADAAGRAATHLEEDLRQLGRLARARFAAHNDHRVLFHGGADRVAPGVDGQRGINGK